MGLPRPQGIQHRPRTQPLLLLPRHRRHHQGSTVLGHRRIHARLTHPAPSQRERPHRTRPQLPLLHCEGRASISVSRPTHCNLQPLWPFPWLEPTASTFSKSANAAPSASCDAPRTSSPAPTSKGGHIYNNPTAAPSSNIRLSLTPAWFPAHPWSEAPQPCRAAPPRPATATAPISKGVHFSRCANQSRRTSTCSSPHLPPPQTITSHRRKQDPPSEFIKTWAASKVLHGNQCPPPCTLCPRP